MSSGYRIRHVDEDVTEEIRHIERRCLIDTGRSHEALPVDLESNDPEVWLAECAYGVAEDDLVHWCPIGFGVLVDRGEAPRVRVDLGDRPAVDRYGWHLRMSGVVPTHQGHGLQRRLIRARLAHARAHGATCVRTYTRPDNAESMRALISCGFRPYRPVDAYAGEDFVYWRKDWT